MEFLVEVATTPQTRGDLRVWVHPSTITAVGIFQAHTPCLPSGLVPTTFFTSKTMSEFTADPILTRVTSLTLPPSVEGSTRGELQLVIHGIALNPYESSLTPVEEGGVVSVRTGTSLLRIQPLWWGAPTPGAPTHPPPSALSLEGTAQGILEPPLHPPWRGLTEASAAAAAVGGGNDDPSALPGEAACSVCVYRLQSGKEAVASYITDANSLELRVWAVELGGKAGGGEGGIPPLPWLRLLLLLPLPLPP